MGALKVLVTGGAGFVGSRFIATLERTCPEWVIDAPSSAKGEDLDITDAAATAAWIKRHRPAAIIHLAAVAAIKDSVNDPRHTWNVNVGGTQNIVMAMQDHAPNAHLVYVSSAEVYGQSFLPGTPVTEAALLQPVNPYAASKAAADILVRQAAVDGLFATIMRPFNHTGAGQTERFAVPSFAFQIAKIEAGLQEPVLSVGSLEDERDFLDVEDVVNAYILTLMSRDRLKPGDIFNISSGIGIRMGDVLDSLLRLSSKAIKVEIDEGRLRKITIPRIVGDSERIRATLGWCPHISFETTLAEVLEERRRFLTP